MTPAAKSHDEMVTMYLDQLRKREKELTDEVKSLMGGLSVVRELIKAEEAKLIDTPEESA
jgi:hypothetical protein